MARQVFWLPRPFSDLPISLQRNSGTQGWAGSLLSSEKGGATAAGPLPILTGFPIKPKWHLESFLKLTSNHCQEKKIFLKNSVDKFILIQYCLIALWIQNSGFPSSVRKTSWEALLASELTKTVEIIGVHSRCNHIYKYGILTLKKIISAPMDIALQTMKNKK